MSSEMRQWKKAVSGVRCVSLTSSARFRGVSPLPSLSFLRRLQGAVRLAPAAVRRARGGPGQTATGVHSPTLHLGDVLLFPCESVSCHFLPANA